MNPFYQRMHVATMNQTCLPACTHVHNIPETSMYLCQQLLGHPLPVAAPGMQDALGLGLGVGLGLGLGMVSHA